MMEHTRGEPAELRDDGPVKIQVECKVRTSVDGRMEHTYGVAVPSFCAPGQQRHKPRPCLLSDTVTKRIHGVCKMEAAS